jgi:hypothetical protein
MFPTVKPPNKASFLSNEGRRDVALPPRFWHGPRAFQVGVKRPYKAAILDAPVPAGAFSRPHI